MDTEHTILLSRKNEFRERFFVIRDQKVLRDPRKTWIIHDIRDIALYSSWFWDTSTPKG